MPFYLHNAVILTCVYFNWMSSANFWIMHYMYLWKELCEYVNPLLSYDIKYYWVNNIDTIIYINGWKHKCMQMSITKQICQFLKYLEFKQLIKILGSCNLSQYLVKKIRFYFLRCVILLVYSFSSIVSIYFKLYNVNLPFKNSIC